MAQAVNNFTVTGNLTKDPELKKTANGKPYTFIVIAVNKQKKGEVNFISLLAWDKLAENAVQYLHKGDCASFMGSIEVFKRNDRTDTQLVVDSMTFLRSSSKPNTAELTTVKAAEEKKPEPANDKFEQVNPDPFAPF